MTIESVQPVFIRDRETTATKSKQRPRQRKPQTPAQKVARLKETSFITASFTQCNEAENTKNKVLPVGTMNNYFYHANLQPKATLEEIREAYMKEGSKSLPIEYKNQAREIIEYQKWGLQENTLLFADGAAGIYRALTGGYKQYFVDFRPVYDTHGTLLKYLVLATFDQLKKCFFGVCVDEYGKLKPGTSEILKKSGILQDFIDAIYGNKDNRGREPCLYKYDKTGNFLGSYKPIMFDGIDEKTGAIKVLLDPQFFAIKVDDDGKNLLADGRYIPTINGLTAICIIGRAYLAKEMADNPEIKRIPNALTAARVIHTLQAAMNTQQLIGIEKPGAEKEKIRLNRTGLIDLVPSCYTATRNYLDFKEASRAMGIAASIIHKGLEVTGGYGALAAADTKNKIYLPDTEKACYFNPKLEKAVFVNCRPLSCFLPGRTNK